MGIVFRRLLLMGFVTILVSMPLLSVSGAVTIPPRAQIVWATGYGGMPNSLNPWRSDPAYGTGFMYEELFGYNAEKGTIIPVIGTSYSWSSTDPTECIVNINPKAKWNDAAATAITADDVVYSYMLAMWNTSRFGPDLRQRLSGGFDASPTEPGSTTAFTACVKVTDTQVKFKTNASFPHTGYLDMWLRSDIPIVPKSVWEVIMNYQRSLPTLNTLDDFTNDWFSTSFNAGWKVCSGPYLPYLRGETNNIEIYKLRSDWWGSGVIHTDLPNTHGVPEAPYIGMIHYTGGNDAQNIAFFQGYIDFFGGFLANVWEYQEDFPGLKTWYGTQAPYFYSASSMVECVPNWQFYPMNQLWFRKALAYAIDYTTYSQTAACGYLQRARQGFIDDRIAPLKSIYNQTIQDTYKIDYNVAAALALLDANCYYEPVDGWSAGGAGWYVKNVTGDDLLKNDAATGLPVTDANGTYEGTQVKLGTYECITVGGWTDVDLAAEMWCTAFTNVLHINTTLTKTSGGSGDPTNHYARMKAGTFDLAMACFSPRLMSDPLVLLNGYRGAIQEIGAAQYDKNTSNWYGPFADQFEQAFEAFEITARDTAESKYYASVMQECLASQIPTIPLYGNGYWYSYFDTYWTGWVNSVDNFNQVTTCWDSSNPAVRARVIYNLKSTGAPDIPWPLIFGIVAIAAIAALVIGIVVMRKRNA